MKKNIITIVISSIILKIIYLIFAFGISSFSQEYHISANKKDVLELFKRNDSFWYQKVAQNLYPKITNPLDLGYSYGKHYKQSVWAHFPAYPVSIRLIEKIFNLNFEEACFLLSLFFSIFSFIGFYFLCIYLFKYKEDISLKYTILFMVFPFHYYFSMYYTEAFFFTFLAFSFVTISIKKYWITSLLLIPLVLVRPNGMACLLPLIVYYIEENGGIKKYYNYFKTLNWSKILNLCFFITAPLAILAYCMYQKHMTNFYFAFVKAQSGWYKEFMFPLMGLFRRGDFTTQFNSIYTIIIIALCIFAAKKNSLSMNLLILINIFLPMSSGSVACMPRYISIIFPITLYIGSYFINSKRVSFIFVFLLILQLATFYPWLISHPFSF